MLYLSKIKLSPKQEHQERLFDIYKLHQKLWKGFDNGEYENKRNFLFRIDKSNLGRKEILTQSQSEPRWDNIFPSNCVQVKNYKPQFIDGQKFYFYLRANAVIAKYIEGKKRSVKQPISPHEYLNPVFDESQNLLKYEGWVVEQGEKHGFQIIEASRVGKVYVNTKKNGNTGIRLNGQNIQGYLKITDEEKFMNIYINGLGRGKAFGFGMLSLIKS